MNSPQSRTRPVAFANPWVGALASLLFTVCRVSANPDGMTVAAGTVTAVNNGNNLDITASQNAVIDWAHFNIGAGETTTFHQPGAVSVVWNRIADANPSQIWGNLNANGIVVLMNQNGFYFGPNSSINVGGFVATTAQVTPPMSAGAPAWAQPATPPLASIINYGSVKVADGGSLFLVAEKIENHGILSAPDGTLGLYAGKSVLLSERPDGRGLSASVDLPEGSVDNTGKLVADGGNIAVHARVVNQEGIVQANSVRERNGVIELVASDSVSLGANSVIQADGDAATMSDGGNIRVLSAGTFTDASGSRIEADGGVTGGNGGDIEVSATRMSSLNSELSAGASAGSHGGSVLIDPYDIELSAVSGGAASAVGVNDSPGQTLTLNIRNISQAASITLQALHDITFQDFAMWRLFDTGGDARLLTLEAGNNINIGDSAGIQAGSGWSVSLSAGVDFSSATHVVQNGVGGIYLNSGFNSADGLIQAQDGDITLRAGHEVVVGNGAVRTVGGGNIAITTGNGDVDAGNNAVNFDYTSEGYEVSFLGLGGIGTANGGNVTVNAGRDILAYNSAIGAFGAGAGNVSLTALRDVQGRFLVRHGFGLVNAGRDVGNGGSGASLALISGGWSVNAAHDLYLNEIYNPNGSLNPYQATFGAGVPFQFDYAEDAFANLSAGNAVSLLGNNLALMADNNSRPPIYAPVLNITAGAGGVTLGNDVVLYPSAQGRLSINTTDGGSLRSSAGNYFQLVISDSGDANYASFINGHADTPLHLGQTGPALQMDIAGDLQNLFLGAAGRADIHVHGNVPSMAFQGQNLAAGDETVIRVDGTYASRSQLDTTTVTLSEDIAAAFERIFLAENQAINTSLAGKLTYNATTRQLTIQGRMTFQDLQFLLNPIRYQWTEANGYTVDVFGNPLPINDTLTTDTAALQALYDATLLNIPTSPLAGAGLQIGGPGVLRVSAAAMDLGVSSGIRSVGTFLNPSLATVSPVGANLILDLAGDLDMTSSQIASFNGGAIAITAGGHMNIGSSSSLTSDSTPKGIYTGHGGSVSVQAGGDINVNGSRIATYDGGDIAVVSQHGSINAGDGAKGFFFVTTSSLNPLTGQVEQRNDKFFGSGIVAFTRADSDARVGDITVRADGDIRAGSGGMLQLAFNRADQNGAKVTVISENGDVHAGESGVLGQNLDVQAPHGSIEGIFVAGQDAAIAAQNNVNVTALAGGSASVSGGGSVSGSIVGGAGASVSGAEVSASVISTGGSASANGSESGGSAFAGVAAAATQKSTEDAATMLTKKEENNPEEEDEKKKGKKIVIAQKVSRVTVILPNKS